MGVVVIESYLENFLNIFQGMKTVVDSDVATPAVAKYPFEK